MKKEYRLQGPFWDGFRDMSLRMLPMYAAFLTLCIYVLLTTGCGDTTVNVPEPKPTTVNNYTDSNNVTNTTTSTTTTTTDNSTTGSYNNYTSPAK